MREGRTEHILLTVGTRGWIILQNEAVARTHAGAPAEGRRHIGSRGDALDALCEGLRVFPSLKLPAQGEDGERIKYTLTLETRYSIIEKNLSRTPDKASSDESKYLSIKNSKTSAMRCSHEHDQFTVRRRLPSIHAQGGGAHISSRLPI